MRTPGATQAEVARRAGVSQRLVSAVLHDNAPNIRVSAGTRERVQRAAAELGYRPNAVARSLVTGRTRTLGFVISTLANPFFAELAEALHRAAWEREYDLFVGLHDGDRDREAQQLHRLLDRRVEGILIWPGHPRDDFSSLVFLAERRAPFLLLGASPPDAGIPSVGVDRPLGMELAVAHLLSMGLTRLAYVGHEVGTRSSHEDSRYEGFLAALARRGLAPAACIRTPDRRPGAGWERQAGYEVGCHFAEVDARPEAVLCAGDQTAFGLMSGLRDRGVRVPEEVAVVGFDGIAEGRFSQPRLTTVAQPVSEITRLGLDSLIALIEGRDLTSRHVIVKPSMVVRESCGAGIARRGSLL